jgi:aminoglycoside 6-adenylyltransferase
VRNEINEAAARMKTATDEAAVLSRLLATVGQHEPVRAIWITSTRANPQARRDTLSDYDIVLFVPDIRPFMKYDAWFRSFGEPLLRVRDSEQVFGVRKHNCMILYSDGTKIDFSIWPLAAFKRMREKGALPDEFDVGYRVLLDKDGLSQGMPSPTYTAHIPRKPSEQEYRSLIEEFWFCATYVAKYLWRGEFIPSKVILDYEIKYLIVRRMLIWRIEIDRDWSFKPGFFGRGLEQPTDPDVWAQLEATYVGPGDEDNWRALFDSIALFRRLAVEVADNLGFTYPHDLDARLTDYLDQIKQLPPQYS